MFITFFFISLIVGLFLGWCLGPFTLWLGKKIENTESAKSSQKKSQEIYDKKIHDKGSTNEFGFNPAGKEERDSVVHYITVVVLLGSIIGMLVSQSSLSVQIFLIILLLVIWKPLFAKLFEFFTSIFQK
jgi:hypothetical protein